MKKIAVYYHLPDGGANRVMNDILSFLKNKYIIEQYYYPKKNIKNRFLKDIEELFTADLKEKIIANKINNSKANLCIVSHSNGLHAPHILKHLKIPSIFICQEPTRALFEHFLGVNSKISIFNKGYEHIYRKIKKIIEINNSKHSTTTISNSIFSGESIFRAYGITSQTIYFGYNNNEFYPINIKKKNQIIVVGNNEPQKNLTDIISIITKIKTKRPKLIVVGYRNNHYQSNKPTANNSLNIEFKTNIKVDVLRQLYNESLITVSTAILEPLGLSIIESQACGTPVIAYNQGGFKETIIDQKTGYLIEFRNKALFKKRIEHLLSNSKLRKQMGLNAIQHAKKYQNKIILKKLDKIIKKLIDN